MICILQYLKLNYHFIYVGSGNRQFSLKITMCFVENYANIHVSAINYLYIQYRGNRVDILKGKLTFK